MTRTVTRSGSGCATVDGPLLARRALVLVLLVVPTAAYARPRADRARAQAAPPAVLIEDLHGSDLNRAVSAAEALGALATAPARAALLRAIGLGAPPPVLLAAIRALGQPGALEAVSLLRHYATYRTAVVRSAALTALARVGGAEAETTIVAALGDGDAPVRQTAAELAVELRLRVAEPLLLRLLQRGDPAAMAALEQLGAARTVEALSAPEAAGAEAGWPTAIRARVLGGLLLRPDFGPDPLRLRVVEALAALRHPAATAALERYRATVPADQRRPSRVAAETAIRGLGR